MSDIVLTAGIRQNLLALQSTASLTSIAQTRLATGKKVNTALDNATNFFTAASLTARSNDLSALLDSMSNGIKTLQTADNGLTTTTKTVEALQSALTRGMQDQTWQGASYTIDTATIGTLTAKNLTFSGGAVGSAANIALQTGTGGTKSTLSTQVAYSSLTPAATSPVLTAANDYTALDMTTGDETYSLDIVDAEGTHTVSIATADNTGGGTTITIDEAITAINADLAAASSSTRVRNNAGRLEFYRSNGATGSTQSITVNNFVTGGTTPTALTATGFASGNTQSGTDAQTYSFTVSDGTTTNTITLNSTNADTLANAISTVNSQLGSSNAFEAFDNNGQLGIREKVANAKALTIAGSSATTLFGVTLTNTGTAGTLTIRTIDELVTAINNDSNLSGKVKATNDNSRLRITNLSTLDLTVAGASSTAINGSATTQTIGGNVVRKNLIIEYNELRAQLDKIVDDSSFNGINLLRGDILKLTFNEMNTSVLNVQSLNAGGINATMLGITTVDDNVFSSDANLSSRLDAVRQALSTLRSQAGAFGSKLALVQNRQDFTKMMIATLQTGADNLVLADTNEEGANLLALQTRQQLSTTALSLANQASQGILRLFG